MKLTAIDREIISSLSSGLPDHLAPYSEVAARVGVSEEDLFSKIERFRCAGLLRRFGATVDQTKIGFAANAMAVWRVPEERVEEAATAIASFEALSHCYEREARPAWPYNLYAMLHAKTREQCEELAAQISRTIGVGEYRLLFTVRQFKKAGPEYFR